MNLNQLKIDQFINQFPYIKNYFYNNNIVKLYNESGTCYVNAVLQSLLNVDDLSKYLITGAFLKDIENDTMFQYYISLNSYLKILHTISKDCSKILYPKLLKNNISMIYGKFLGTEQQDCNEFLLTLLNNFEKCLSYNYKINIEENSNNIITKLKYESEKNILDYYNLYGKSKIFDLFYGQYINSIICQKCNNRHYTFEIFNTIELPISVFKKEENEYNGFKLSSLVTIIYNIIHVNIIIKSKFFKFYFHIILY